MVLWLYADNFEGEDEEGEGIILQTRYPWEGTDRDYKYEEVSRLSCTIGNPL